MRKILFKAKRIDNSEWVEGCFVKAERLNGIGFDYVIIEVEATGKTHNIDESTICQYTGLTDRHGNKLWDNDIVEIVSSQKTSYKYLLWWNKEMSLMDAIPLDGIDFDGHDYWNGNYPNFHYETFCTMMQDPWGDFSDIKVIGNIIDNPELIERK